MSVGIDAMTLIWGLRGAQKPVKKATTQNVGEMRARAIILFQNLSHANATVIVPTVAVSELLSGIETAKHGSFMEELQRRFSVHPFDLKAASIAASLWRMLKEKPEDEPRDRPLIKADLMIIATVKAVGGRIFYSHEPWCRSVAERAGLTPRNLPTHNEDMFADLEARREAEEDV